MNNTEDDTYKKLIQTPFIDVLGAHVALNLATEGQINDLLEEHHWTRKDYTAALNNYYSTLVGQPIEIQLGTETNVSELVRDAIYYPKSGKL